MQTLNQAIDSINAQLAPTLAFKRDLAKSHIENALKCVELHELIEMANDIYAEQFAQGEIATHHTTQQQIRIEKCLSI